MNTRSMPRTIDYIREIVVGAYRGASPSSGGVTVILKEVLEELHSYLDCIEGIAGPQPVIPPKKRFAEIKNIVARANKRIEKELRRHSEKEQEALCVQITNLLAILEHFRVIGFFIQRLADGTRTLTKEIAKLKRPDQRSDVGISSFARLEIKDLCQRMHTLQMFSEHVISGDSADPPVSEEIKVLAKQLNAFAAIAMDRHKSRLEDGLCRMKHDLPYRRILDSSTSIAMRLTSVVRDWSASFQED